MTRLLFALIFGIFASTVTVFAQPAQPAAPTPKIVIVNTNTFFDEKAGIARILTAAKNLSAELAGRRAEVTQLGARIQQVEKEVATFRDNVAKGVPIDETAARTKGAEFDRLKLEVKYKEDEFNAHAQRRQTQVVGPEYSAAMTGLAEYIRTRGFGLVFDVAKDEGGLLIFATPQYDITKDFITFYNTRPPTAINSVPKQ